MLKLHNKYNQPGKNVFSIDETYSLQKVHVINSACPNSLFKHYNTKVYRKLQATDLA